jgi:hypothetical protein
VTGIPVAQTLPAHRAAGNQNLSPGANQRRLVPTNSPPGANNPSDPTSGTAEIPVFSKIHAWNNSKSAASLRLPYFEFNPGAKPLV